MEGGPVPCRSRRHVLGICWGVLALLRASVLKSYLWVFGRYRYVGAWALEVFAGTPVTEAPLSFHMSYDQYCGYWGHIPADIGLHTVAISLALMGSTRALI